MLALQKNQFTHLGCSPLKIPEVWQYEPGKLIINLLTNTGYLESETSLAFGSFPVKQLTQFMELEPQKGENARMGEFREWVRAQLSGSN